MPHELHEAITSYINDSGKTKLGNDDSLQLVLIGYYVPPKQKGTEPASLPLWWNRCALRMMKISTAGWLDTTLEPSSAKVVAAWELPGPETLPVASATPNS
jgi:hypothetical protein